MEEASTIIDDLVCKYDADANRIGVTGHSMGGFTAAGIFTHNPRYKGFSSVKWFLVLGKFQWVFSQKSHIYRRRMKR